MLGVTEMGLRDIQQRLVEANVSPNARLLLFTIYIEICTKSNKIVNRALVEKTGFGLCTLIAKRKELIENGLLLYKEAADGGEYAVPGDVIQIHGTLSSKQITVSGKCNRKQISESTPESVPEAIPEAQMMLVPVAPNVPVSEPVQKPKAKAKSKSKGNGTGRETQTYGDFGWVALTEAEYNNLAETYGEAVRDEYIHQLDWFIEERKDNQKIFSDYMKRNHNLTIQNWMRRGGIQKIQKSASGKVNGNAANAPTNGVVDMFNSLMEDE